ncbi:MAG: penicillin acylase family protein [Roseiflexaceae bacterium]|nr:penicillin acylase family protein [Roseiflexaceae bacterium]
MKLFFRIVIWLAATLAVLALVAGAGGYFWLRRALPEVSGSVRVGGIGAPVTITRDADAVPHIQAANEADALFGLGYVHAQDRLWQMEFQRRVGFGRLSELLGEATLETDKFLRTLGTGRAAQSAWQNMPAADRTLVEAYVGGINAYLASGAQLPVEFVLLGAQPAPFTPEEVLVWSKMLSYNLGGNYEDELLRVELQAQLGPERTALLMPAWSEADPLVLPNTMATLQREPLTRAVPDQAGAAAALLRMHKHIQDTLGLGGKLIGSNNWVIGGARTTTGKPLLADDPHLGAQTPSIWYLAHIQGGGIDAIGATVPGLPGVVIGHNQRIAWGVTNTGPDVQDLFIERINGDNQAEYDGELEPVQLIEEIIKVKDRPDVPISVRVTRHGPIISDVLENAGEPMALRWTALDAEDNTFPAFLGINRAQDWPQFTAALEQYHGPMQNFVYADVDGNIGYYAPGKLPMRTSGDGTAPVPGWTSQYEWSGYVPHADLPQVYNPPEGYIASANNRVAGPGYPHMIGSSFAAPYRARRIIELITAKQQLSPADMAAMHADVSSVQARELLPRLLEIAPLNERGRMAIELLRSWDGTMAADSAAAAVYAAWYQELPTALIGDELGEELLELYGGASADFFAISLAALLRDEGGFCDNSGSPEREDCDQRLAQALEAGLAAMAIEQGGAQLASWRWDKAHTAYFPHNPFDNVAALKGAFSRSIPNGGDKFTVNVAPVRRADFDQRHVPSYRHIVDLSDMGASQYMNTLGQSGQPLSGDYSNLLQRWQRVEYLPMRFATASISEGARGTLTLAP